MLAGIKFGENRYYKNIGGFKFGGSVRDRQILADFNLAIVI